MSAQLTKEFREIIRTWKILIVPIVFILLAVGQPVTSKLLPVILKNAGNVPPGAVIDIPVPSGAEVMASILRQLDLLGLLTIVMVAMGSVAGERVSGVAATILSKPVKWGSYVAAKAITYGSLATISLFAALALSGYYTELLIGPIDWPAVLTGGMVYTLYLLFVVSVTIMFSTFMKSPLAAGGASLGIIFLMSIIAPLLPFKGWLPTAISGYAAQFMLGSLKVDFQGAAMVTLACTLGAMTLALEIFRRQEI